MVRPLNIVKPSGNHCVPEQPANSLYYFWMMEHSRTIILSVLQDQVPYCGSEYLEDQSKFTNE